VVITLYVHHEFVFFFVVMYLFIN